jgi:hypothetical protein
VLARPVVAEGNLVYLPAMVAEAATWLTQMSKTAVQMAVPDKHEELGALLEAPAG